MLKFDPNWLNWDTDAKEISKLEAKESSGTLTDGGKNSLAGLRELRKKREEGAIFLTCFNQVNVQAALHRSSSRFKSSPEANQLLLDIVDLKQTVTIKQGTHQAEDADSGDGYMLHFDAHSSRNGKCFHLYVGQLSTGAVTINSIAYQPTPKTSKVALPDQPDMGYQRDKDDK
jgi:hypothetical protein